MSRILHGLWVSVPGVAALQPVWAAASLSLGWSTLVILVAAVSGAIASVAGFGIGSILTPLLAWQEGTKFAVATISIPHRVGTSLPFWRLRKHIDRRVLISFGLASAADGLLGALLHIYFKSPVLRRIPEPVFRRVIGDVLLGLGALMFFEARMS